MDYIVSSHGGRYDNTGNTAVPDGVKVKFFVADNVELSNDRADATNSWDIYERLRAGAADDIAHVEALVVETVENANVLNYYCWAMDEDAAVQAASGIFEVGGARVAALPDEDHAKQISDLIAELPNVGTIYWVACRTSEPAPAAAAPAAVAAAN